MNRRQEADARARQELDDQEAQLRRLQARVEGMEVSLERLSARLEALSTASDQRSEAYRADILEVKRGLKSAEDARTSMRNEIVNDLSRKMAQLMKQSQPASSGSQVGRWHTVESGQTLSQIAKAYGVSIKAIVSSNNSLTSENSIIRVGQKLFIPD